MSVSCCHALLFLSLILYPLICIPVYAAGPGTGSANFLKIPVGARETALGGAFTAVADNANSVYYNPAGLSLLEKPEVSFTYNKYVDGVSQQWLAAAHPYKSGAFGLGVNYLSVSPFDAYDNADNPTGSVSAYDMAMYFSWGARLPLASRFLKSVSYGASLKYISEKLDTEKGTGYGLDLGFLAVTAVENLRFGFNVENAVSTRIKFIEAGARPPLKFKTGAIYEIRSSVSPITARFSLDYVFWNDRPGYMAVGMENLFYDAFAVRLGYNGFGDISNGLNFGLGFDLSGYTGRNISVDYSYGATYAFGDIHKLGVTYKFGRPAVGRTAAPAAFHPNPVVAGAGPVLAEPVVSTAAAGLAPKETPIDYYINTLNTGSLEQKRAALAELGERGGNDSFNLLLALLKDDNPSIVLAAVSALSGFNDQRVIEPLIALFNIKNVNIRLAAAGVLGKYGGARAVEALQAALKKEKVKKVRR
ncbi:MAG: PorV/PorQ family protein, partial [Elusimicrobiota bacterium]|nr:PorV/PorQ family protein [Elusimicrobiota bacterium]